MATKSPTGARNSTFVRQNSLGKKKDDIKNLPKLYEPDVHKMNPEITRGLTDQEVEIEHLK